MYQHDTELTGKFARENPGIIFGAQEKLNIRIPVYRFRCPQCGIRHSIPKGSYIGKAIQRGDSVSCGDCALHRGQSCKLILINETA